MTPEQFVQLCRARGITTETRLRRTVRRQYPHLEEWQISKLTAPPATGPLWIVFPSRGDGTFMGGPYIAAGKPVFKPWRAPDE